MNVSEADYFDACHGYYYLEAFIENKKILPDFFFQFSWNNFWKDLHLLQEKKTSLIHF